MEVFKCGLWVIVMVYGFFGKGDDEFNNFVFVGFEVMMDFFWNGVVYVVSVFYSVGV